MKDIKRASEIESVSKIIKERTYMSLRLSLMPVYLYTYVTFRSTFGDQHPNLKTTYARALAQSSNQPL